MKVIIQRHNGKFQFMIIDSLKYFPFISTDYTTKQSCKVAISRKINNPNIFKAAIIKDYAI
jgi:hypothetical protein